MNEPLSMLQVNSQLLYLFILNFSLVWRALKNNLCCKKCLTYRHIYVNSGCAKSWNTRSLLIRLRKLMTRTSEWFVSILAYVTAYIRTLLLCVTFFVKLNKGFCINVNITVCRYWLLRFASAPTLPRGTALVRSRSTQSWERRTSAFGRTRVGSLLASRLITAFVIGRGPWTAFMIGWRLARVFFLLSDVIAFTVCVGQPSSTDIGCVLWIEKFSVLARSDTYYHSLLYWFT